MSDRLLDVKIDGDKRVFALVNLLKKSDAERKKILKKVAKRAKKHSQENRRKQQGPDGEKWEKRRNGRGKMMKKLGKYLRDTANSDEASLQFNNTMVAKLAYAHHHGIGEVFDNEKQRTERDSQNTMTNKTAIARAAYGVNRNSTQPATKTQAQRMIDNGFRIKKRREKNGKMRNGYKGKIPSKRWIVTNLTRGQAGAIIRENGWDTGESKKKNYKIPRPARPWVGISWQQTQELADFIVDEILEQN